MARLRNHMAHRVAVREKVWDTTTGQDAAGSSISWSMVSTITTALFSTLGSRVAWNHSNNLMAWNIHPTQLVMT